MSEWTRVTLVVLAIVIIISLIVPAASPTETAWTWLWSVDALSYIKVVVTVLKYWPQVCDCVTVLSRMSTCIKI